MNARRRLNAGYLQGSAAIAALIGLVSSSWFAFGVALLVLIMGSVLAGDIRIKGRNPKGPGR